MQLPLGFKWSKEDCLTFIEVLLLGRGIFVTERRSGALSQKDASRNGVPELFFSCHRYNEVRRVLLSCRSSF
jgi:hypothetical protein